MLTELHAVESTLQKPTNSMNHKGHFEKLNANRDKKHEKTSELTELGYDEIKLLNTSMSTDKLVFRLYARLCLEL